MKFESTASSTQSSSAKQKSLYPDKTTEQQPPAFGIHSSLICEKVESKSIHLAKEGGSPVRIGQLCGQSRWCGLGSKFSLLLVNGGRAFRFSESLRPFNKCRHSQRWAIESPDMGVA